MTPHLINVNIEDFDQYIASLSKSAKKNYKVAEKKNQDITYCRIDFDPKLVNDFMSLWERQVVAGQRIKWTIKLPYLEYLAKKNKLLCFCAKISDSDDIICVHFVEHYDTFVICGAPLYDKDQHSDRYIAKYMWFNLIEYAINHPKIEWVDFGGWGTDTWRDSVFLYKKGIIKSYKWHYVPEFVKENPQLAEPLIVRANIFNCNKCLKIKKYNYLEPLYSIKWKIARFIYAHRGQRLEQIYRLLSKLVRPRELLESKGNSEYI